MPTIQGTDYFNHGDFTVPGGGNYESVSAPPPTKDLTIVRSADPASMLITGVEEVYWTITGTEVLGWMGFFFRQNSGEEPSSASTLCVMYDTSYTGANGLQVRYLQASNSLQWYSGVNVGGAATMAITLDEWHWCEFICDFSTSTFTGYARIDGIDGGTVTEAGNTPSTFAHVYVGGNDATANYRFSRVMRGTAASTSDWLGQPSSATTTDIFPITIGTNDGRTKRLSTSYPPVSGDTALTDTDSTWLQTYNIFSTPNYDLSESILRFDTSLIPDGATIISAILQLYYFGGGANCVIHGDWTDGAAISSSDWIDVGSSPHSAFASKDTDAFTPETVVEIVLSNPVININRSGYTGLRIILIPDTTPPAGDNTIFFAAYDHATLQEPRLVVTYTTAPSVIMSSNAIAARF